MRRLLNVVALLVMVTAGPMDAQIATEGTVRGVARDAGGGVLPGVTVTAVSPTAPGRHINVSESDGQYRLLNLQPGVFDIVAELAGFTKYRREGVEVRAGLNLTLDIVLTLGNVEESVTVRGDSPLLETQKPIQAVNIAGDLQRMLPLSTRRDLTDALEVTPGVTARNLIANNGTQTYMLRGTDVEQHVVQIDGADMVTSRQGRMETVRLPTNAVADSQVNTGGADASASAGLCVVFNVTTKVGANRFAGTAGVHHQNRGWNADNDPLGVPAIAESSEVEASLGGADSSRSRVVLCLVFLSPSQQPDLTHVGPVEQPSGVARPATPLPVVPLGHQIGSPNFAYGPDGTFRGQNRQAARTAQLALQFEF
jgi:hypothetical protein